MDLSEESQGATATVPKNWDSIEDFMALLAIDEEAYHCISESGEKISIKKSIIEKIPYFEAFFPSRIRRRRSGQVQATK